MHLNREVGNLFLQTIGLNDGLSNSLSNGGKRRREPLAETLGKQKKESDCL